MDPLLTHRAQKLVIKGLFGTGITISASLGSSGLLSAVRVPQGQELQILSELVPERDKFERSPCKKDPSDGLSRNTAVKKWGVVGFIRPEVPDNPSTNIQGGDVNVNRQLGESGECPRGFGEV